MSSIKIIYNFSSVIYNDIQLHEVTTHIIECMASNPHFPDPTPALSTVSSLNALYSEALKETINGDHESITIKNAARKKLEQILRQLALYVQNTAEDNAEIISTSGFAIRKPSKASLPLDKVTGITLQSGININSIIIKWNKVERARFYEVAYADAPTSNTSNWTYATTTKTRMAIAGLIKGKPYSFKVAAAGSNPARNWSDPVNSFIL